MPRGVTYATIIAATVSIGCSSGREFDPDNLDLSGLTAGDSLKRNIISHWNGIASACPGIKTYKEDLTVAGIESHYEGHIEIALKVADRPVSIPLEFRALGHTCHFMVSANGDSLSIGKRACVSVCTESVAETSFLSLPLQ